MGQKQNNHGKMQQQSITAQPIAVIGLACQFPGANNLLEFWDILNEGTEGISHFDEEFLTSKGVDKALLLKSEFVKAKGVIENYDLFDAEFFGYTDQQAALLNPQHRLFLQCIWHALENAGYYREKEAGKIGIFAGEGSFGTYLSYLESNRGMDSKSPLEHYQLIISHAADYLTTCA